MKVLNQKTINMTKIKSILFFIFLSIFTLYGCGGADIIEEEISANGGSQDNKNENNDSNDEQDKNDDSHGDQNKNDIPSTIENVQIKDGTVYNTNTSNRIVGSWIDPHYFLSGSEKYHNFKLYCFDDAMRYKRCEKDVSPTPYDLYEEEGTYYIDRDSICFVNDRNGRLYKRKFKWISPNKISIGAGIYFATTLKGLKDDDSPCKEETGIKLNHYFEENGDLRIELTPNWGMSRIYYILSKENNAKPSVGSSKPVIKTYANLEPGVCYYLRMYGVDKKGLTHTLQTTAIQNLGTYGVRNRLVYWGKNYNLVSATMSQHHAGASGNSNWKTLTFSDNENNQLKFEYATPYYDGINLDWGEGTYRITQSSSFYQYNASFWRDGKCDFYGSSLEGKLTIKKPSSNYYVFDFDLEILKGHFEGTVQK